MKNLLFHRDFLILALLLFMLKVGIEIREPAIDAAPLLQSPAAHVAHNEKETTPNPEKIIVHNVPLEEDDDSWQVSGHDGRKARQPAEPFLAHEVDQNILKQIDCVQKQISQALDITQPTSLDAAQLRSIQQKISQLRKQYQSTSPAVALLGPLGTAAIVLKEEDLEKELLETTHKFASILHTISGNDYNPAKSVVKELETNHHLLHDLSHA